MGNPIKALIRKSEAMLNSAHLFSESTVVSIALRRTQQPQPHESMPSAPPSINQILMTSPQHIVIVENAKFGPNPRTMKCYHCMESIVTITSTKPGILAYILGAVLCFVGCACGCCLIPCLIDATQDIMHECPKCNNFLGSYQKP